MQFRIGTVPIHVRGQFLLTALFLGMNEREPVKLAVWVAVVAVSVIIHELGHAFVGKAFGLTPSIVLEGMGGLTSFGEMRRPLGRWHHIAISLAGPFAGFLFGGIVFALYARMHPSHPLAQLALVRLVEVNIGWGIFNLLPMLPLDGGNVFRALVKSEKVARIASIVVAVGIGLLALRSSQWWIVFLGVMFTFQNVQALRSAQQRGVDEPLVKAIQEGQAALQRDDFRSAIALLEPALAAPGSRELRQIGFRVYVIALLSDGQIQTAVNVVEREQRTMGAEDLAQYAAAFRQLGHERLAEKIEGFGKPPALSEFRA